MTRIEQFLAAGAYLQARREAERLLLSESLTLREQGQAYELLCRASLALSELFTAAQYGEKALRCAEAAGDLVTLAKIHGKLGTAYAQIGDGHLAERHLRAYLTLVAHQPSLSGEEGMVRYHLALSHRQRRQWVAAAQAFRLAANSLEREGRPLEQIRCQLNAAWCHLMIPAPAEAEPCLALAAALLQRYPDDALLAHLLCYRALYHRLHGDVATSTCLCHEIYTPGRQGVCEEHLALGAWIMGENSLDLGQSGEAELFCNLAQGHAIRSGLPSLMNLVCGLKRRIAGVEAY